MILKWAIGGAVVGLLFSVFTGTNVLVGIVVGGVLGVAIRKWIVRHLWM